MRHAPRGDRRPVRTLLPHSEGRLHLDVRAHDIPAATERAEALGARRVGGPEGNEWCLVSPP